MIIYAARVDGSDITHLAEYVGLDDNGEGLLRAVCIAPGVTQQFVLVRAEEDSRMVWCGACQSYRDYLAALTIIGDADPLLPRLNGRVKLPPGI